MKLEATNKDFPKTFRYIKAHIPTCRVHDLINKYALDGLQILNPKNNKIKVALSNEVTNSSDNNLLIHAMDEYNNCLHVDNLHSVIIYYSVTSTNSVLLDNEIHDKLLTFTKEYYHIGGHLVKYMDLDSLLLHALKTHQLHLLTLKDNYYVGIDLYEDKNAFYYNNEDLTMFYLAFTNHNQKFLNSITTDTESKLRQDSRKYVKFIKPTLPILMDNYSKYYRLEAKHGWLLYTVSKYLHI